MNSCCIAEPTEAAETRNVRTPAEPRISEASKGTLTLRGQFLDKKGNQHLHIGDSIQRLQHCSLTKFFPLGLRSLCSLLRITNANPAMTCGWSLSARRVIRRATSIDKKGDPFARCVVLYCVIDRVCWLFVSSLACFFLCL